MAAPLHTVVETAVFIRKAAQIGLTDEERQGIVDEVAADPEAGDEVIASNVRKRRIAGRGQGRSGGYRIAVAYFGSHAPAFILTLLSKGQASVFTADQKKAIGAATEAISALLKSGKRGT